MLLTIFFFFNNTATTEIYTSIDTLSLHDALPISRPPRRRCAAPPAPPAPSPGSRPRGGEGRGLDGVGDPEGERQRLCAGGARHDDLLVAPHGADEALELEPERLGLRRLEPHVLDDLLEARSGEGLPPWF